MIRTPAKRPEVMCDQRGKRYPCNRSQGHTGKHFFAWYGLGGRIRDVW